MTLLEKAKSVCRITSTAFDDEIEGLIDAAKAEIAKTTDIGVLDETDPLIIRAIMTYVSMNFKLSNGQIDTGSFDRLKESYDEQKKQMIMSTMYRGA